MSLPEIRRSDSFSIDEQPPQFGNEIAPKNQRPKPLDDRSDSPVFGSNKGSNKQGAMFVDDDFQSVSPSSKHLPAGIFSGDPSTLIFDLKQKIKKTEDEINQNQEEYRRNQLLHIETINMMTKYQLVFLKLENAITKIGNLFRTKHCHFRAYSFSKILKASNNKEDDLNKYKLQIAYHTMKANVEGFTGTLKRYHRRPLLNAFKTILLHSKLVKADKNQRDDREKYSRTFQETMSAKDSEIHEFKKKIEDLNLHLSSARQKESELTTKITNKEKQIYVLEKERNELLKTGKSSSNQKLDLKSLEEQLYQLQAENDDLKEKLMAAEDNVGSFIREMSDLLDSHELSTNLLSDNNSFNYQDHDEDENRHRDKPSSYYTQGKPSSKDTSKLSSGNVKAQSTKGFSKNQQINFCFVHFDNPELNQPDISRASTSLFNRKALQNKPSIDIKTQKSSFPEYEIEIVENLPPMPVAKGLDDEDMKELFYPRAVKKLTWDQNGDKNAGPKIMELAGDKKGTSGRGQRTSGDTRRDDQRESSRSPQKSMDKRENQDENEEQEFDEQQARSNRNESN